MQSTGHRTEQSADDSDQSLAERRTLRTGGIGVSQCLEVETCLQRIIDIGRASSRLVPNHSNGLSNLAGRVAQWRFESLCSFLELATIYHRSTPKTLKLKRDIRSTALSKAVSSIPTCGYVDRRDKIDHHVRKGKNMNGRTYQRRMPYELALKGDPLVSTIQSPHSLKRVMEVGSFILCERLGHLPLWSLPSLRRESIFEN